MNVNARFSETSTFRKQELLRDFKMPISQSQLKAPANLEFQVFAVLHNYGEVSGAQ